MPDRILLLAMAMWVGHISETMDSDIDYDASLTHWLSLTTRARNAWLAQAAKMDAAIGRFVAAHDPKPSSKKARPQ